jgi:hypothetical protein
LNKLEFPSHKDNMYQVWLNLACWFWRRRFLKIFSVVLLFCYYLPWRGAIPFIWINLNPLYPMIFCTKFDWIWPAGSGKEDF